MFTPVAINAKKKNKAEMRNREVHVSRIAILNRGVTEASPMR